MMLWSHQEFRWNCDIEYYNRLYNLSIVNKNYKSCIIIDYMEYYLNSFRFEFFNYQNSFSKV